MAAYEFSAPRLYVAGPLLPEGMVSLDSGQTNYLVNVLRLTEGDKVLVFDGASGEWRARLVRPSRKTAALRLEEQARAQTPPTDLWLLFAPLKQARLDYMIQKAVEMGASRLVPVITRRTQVSRLNMERMTANAIEAAEQCGILNLPEIITPQPLGDVLGGWSETARTLVFCDEEAALSSPLAALETVPVGPLAVLIGPEGGFAPEERSLILARKGALAISLGPRILRADTAAVAALALVQARLGDWT